MPVCISVCVCFPLRSVYTLPQAHHFICLGRLNMLLRIIDQPHRCWCVKESRTGCTNKSGSKRRTRTPRSMCFVFCALTYARAHRYDIFSANSHRSALFANGPINVAGGIVLARRRCSLKHAARAAIRCCPLAGNGIFCSRRMMTIDLWFIRQFRVLVFVFAGNLASGPARQGYFRWHYRPGGLRGAERSAKCRAGSRDLPAQRPSLIKS